SRYRVRQDVGTTLSFDTYNYISILNSPDPNLYGGTIRTGFSSDIDFVYDYSTADSIIFVGKRYRQVFKLGKATAAQQTAYNGGGYLTAINGFRQFFATHFNNYVDIGGTKVALGAVTDSSLATGKRMTFTRTVEGSAVAVTQKFAYTVDKMALAGSGAMVLDKQLMHTAMKGAGTMAVYDAAGTEYVV